MSSASSTPEAVLDLARPARKIVAFTGAGMSAESGVATFRDADTGLWERYDPMQLSTPEAWKADPELVWGWYRWRAAIIQGVQPNPGHLALAEWARRPGIDIDVVTQNFDDLHERAGSEVLNHLHGSLFDLRCADCGEPANNIPLPETATLRMPPPHCPRCNGLIRPGVVWFGEPLPMDEFDDAARAMQEADLVLVIGTSSTVYPAAGLPLEAQRAGVPVVEIGPLPTDFSNAADVVWRSTAGLALPALVHDLANAVT